MAKEKYYEIFNELEGYKKGILIDFNDLSQDQLNFKMKTKNWSLLQIVEHIILAETGTINYVNKKLLGKESLKNSGFFSFLRSKTLNYFMNSGIRFKARVETTLPAEQPNLKEITLKWDIARNAIKRLIDASDETLLQKQIFKHPLAGRINGLQMLEFLQIHLKRHFKQIVELKKHPAFPGNEVAE